ncbi:MAG: hypothetical protein MK171_03065 [Pirellulales bacterium]|nr:hypothetical protein [Pirellulales bacterium]
MRKLAVLLVAATFWFACQADVEGQTAYVTYYQPVTVCRPYIASCPAPQVACYAPAVAPVMYQPVARVRTRYRGFLGGVVSRVRYGYRPASVVPYPVMRAY